MPAAGGLTGGTIWLVGEMVCKGEKAVGWAGSGARAGGVCWVVALLAASAQAALDGQGTAAPELWPMCTSDKSTGKGCMREY